MKNILKRIIVFSIVLLLSISNTNSYEIVNALRDITKIQKNETIEIYEVKDKDEVIIANNLVDYYETDPNKEEVLAYIAEQERLEQERIAKLQLKNNIAGFAKQFIGNPYVLGGNSLVSGTDCSGLVQLVYATYGITLPRTTEAQSITGTSVSIENIEVGDIIAYGYDGSITHTAIYIGNGMIVHASTPELGIRIDNMYLMPIITIRSVI